MKNAKNEILRKDIPKIMPFPSKTTTLYEDTILDVWISELNEIRNEYRAHKQYTSLGRLKLKRISKEIKEELEIL
jgi:hypothetical protein